MIHYSNCPICFSEQVKPSLTAKDHTVSGKEFAIWECEFCRAKFTQGVPSEEKIGAFYSSEDYISHSETRQGVVNRLYHVVRNFTVKQKRRIVRKYSGRSKGNILDVGCGTGAFLAEMRKEGWDIKGIEPDAGARTNAATLHGIIPSEPAELFHLEKESYDVITLWHVLEHIHRLHDYLQQMKMLLKPGGLLIIAVPNHTSTDASHYKQDWAAYDVPRHLYHFSPESMHGLAKQYGFQMKKILPMWFDSFYVSMLSEKYKGRSNFLSAILQGGFSNMKALFKTSRCSSVIYVMKKQ